MSTSTTGGQPDRERRRVDEAGLTRRHDAQDQVDHDRTARDRARETARREEVVSRTDVQDRQRAAFGGMKLGSAFFGWLTAVGLTVLLAALVAATGTAIGFSTQSSVDDAADDATSNVQTVGVVGAVVLLVILLVAYFAGGYVAGRMARFDGAKQGLGVWLWAVLVAAVGAVLGIVAGDRFDVLAKLDALPSIPVSADDATTTGVVALVTVAVVTLAGAVLGGLAGMRYHRKVDRAGFDERV